MLTPRRRSWQHIILYYGYLRVPFESERPRGDGNLCSLWEPGDSEKIPELASELKLLILELLQTDTVSAQALPLGGSNLNVDQVNIGS